MIICFIYVISRSDVNNLNTHGFAYLMNTSDILTKWLDHPGERKLQPPHEPKSTLMLLWNKPPHLVAGLLWCCPPDAEGQPWYFYADAGMMCRLQVPFDKRCMMCEVVWQHPNCNPSLPIMLWTLFNIDVYIKTCCVNNNKIENRFLRTRTGVMKKKKKLKVPSITTEEAIWFIFLSLLISCQEYCEYYLCWIVKTLFLVS